jgi:hypothetical protein
MCLKLSFNVLLAAAVVGDDAGAQPSLCRKDVWHQAVPRWGEQVTVMMMKLDSGALAETHNT